MTTKGSRRPQRLLVRSLHQPIDGVVQRLDEPPSRQERRDEYPRINVDGAKRDARHRVGSALDAWRRPGRTSSHRFRACATACPPIMSEVYSSLFSIGRGEVMGLVAPSLPSNSAGG